MRHPTDGTLRRLLDEPAGVADVDREHIGSCAVCLAGLAAARRDAAAADSVLDLPVGAEVGTDVDAGWRRLSRAMAADRPERVASPPRRRWRPALRSPVVVAVGVVVLVAGAGAAAAADWLQIFRTEQVAPVTASEADLVKLPDLTAFGSVEVTQQPDVHQVSDAASAADATGMTAPRVDTLPPGVSGEPTYYAGGPMSALFTFSAAKAAAFETENGGGPPPPAGLDGSQFRLTAGPGLAAVWSGSQGPPALAVARAVPPAVYSSGVPFETVRDYLLSLPGLPDDVATQLKGFAADGTTLPLFLIAGKVSSSTADVNGVPATVVTSVDGAMAGVVWVDDGVVTAVAGSLTADEVLSVARGLR